jgi:hypothetical protein
MAIKRSHAGGALRKKIVSSVATRPTEDGAIGNNNVNEEDEHK